MSDYAADPADDGETLRAITVLYEPPRVVTSTPGAQGQWNDPLASFHGLGQALQRCTTAPVTVRTGYLHEISDGVVLVRSSDYEAMMEEVSVSNRASVAGRTLLLDADRANVFVLLERYRFAGAIEKHRFFEWRTRPDREAGGGLYGLRKLAPTLDATCFEAPSFQSENYCVLRSTRYADLPSLIVGYLEVLMSSVS